MTREEMQKWRKQDEERRAKNKQEAIELLKKELPDLEIDPSKLTVDGYGSHEWRYQTDNLAYYHINLIYGYVSKLDTDLGHTVAWNKEYGTPFQLIETYNYVIVAANWSEYSVFTTTYWKHNGRRVKGKKYSRAVNSNGKGLYVTLQGKRYYREGAQV